MSWGSGWCCVCLYQLTQSEGQKVGDKDSSHHDIINDVPREVGTHKQTPKVRGSQPQDAVWCLTSTTSVQVWVTRFSSWGSMTATWIRALGFLSLPEATRSLQAAARGKRRGGREGSRRMTREKETKVEQGREQIRGYTTYRDTNDTNLTGQDSERRI